MLARCDEEISTAIGPDRLIERITTGQDSTVDRPRCHITIEIGWTLLLLRREKAKKGNDIHGNSSWSCCSLGEKREKEKKKGKKGRK